MSKGLTLSMKEQARLQVLNSVLEQRCGVEEAAMVLGLSERHVWRLLAAYRKEGAAALAHGNRGRHPVNALSVETEQRVVALAQGRYAGANHTHLTELLAEREGIVLGRSTLRRLLMGAGLRSPRKRRPPRHRHRRERSPQEGMLVQIDGSRHDWLEGRGPWLTLHLAVDDATSTVPWAVFRAQEDAIGYFRLLRGIIETKGLPLALYTDRHGIFQVNPERPLSLEEELAGGQVPTQFGRALEELGIARIAAHSPQAKGRVERGNGTFQDRLVTELRLAGATTEAEANQVLETYLARHNARFGVPPAEEETAYRPTPPGLDLDSVLCFKHRRVVANDNTVRFQGRLLQLLPDAHRASYARAHVEVQEGLDGCITVCYQGRRLTSKEVQPGAGPTVRGESSPPPESVARAAGKSHKPGPGHPWRRPWRKSRSLTKSLNR